MSQLCPVARRFNYSSIRSKAPFFPSSELIFHSVCSRCMAPLLLTSPKSLVSGFAIKPDALCMRLRLSRHTQQRPQQLVNELASSGGVDGKLICWKWSSLSLSLFFSPSLSPSERRSTVSAERSVVCVTPSAGRTLSPRRTCWPSGSSSTCSRCWTSWRTWSAASRTTTLPTNGTWEHLSINWYPRRH